MECLVLKTKKMEYTYTTMIDGIITEVEIRDLTKDEVESFLLIQSEN